ncbi:unnamed protein product [Rhodiola kirilowii]
MDITRAFEVVTSRIKEIETHEIAMRIVGFLLLQCGEEEMIRLAHATDLAIANVVQTVRSELCGRATNLPVASSLNPAVSVDILMQFNPFSPRSFSPPVAIDKPMPNWNGHVVPNQQLNGSAFSPLPHHDAFAELENMTRSMSLVDRYEQGELGNLYLDESFRNTSGRISRRSLSSTDFPTKQCHYFQRGSCKNGNSCPYSHEQTSPGSISPLLHAGTNHFVSDEYKFLSGSLQKLEMEITELLKVRGGGPIPIATLPGIYYDMYGRALQADGYLTESQRNGKAGYGLTKLLARLKNICIIDRPNGQHSLILAEDVPKYFEYRPCRNSPGPIVSGSHQIYLTFPAESTFTEDDVAEYFSEFGKVEDVRMPCNQERNFGFVTFSSPETVSTVLSMSNPHEIGGSSVLVKPYREKSKQPNRRVTEDPVYYSQPYTDMDSEFLFSQSPRGLEAPRFFNKQQLREEYMRDLNRQRPVGFQLARNVEFPPAGHSGSLPDDSLINQNTANYLGPINTRSESAQENGLPDSPFSSPMSRNVITTTSA